VVELVKGRAVLCDDRGATVSLVSGLVPVVIVVMMSISYGWRLSRGGAVGSATGGGAVTRHSTL
jgi:hypothetical protein